MTPVRVCVLGKGLLEFYRLSESYVWAQLLNLLPTAGQLTVSPQNDYFGLLYGSGTESKTDIKLQYRILLK